MKRFEYITYSLKTDNFLKLEWYVTFFSILNSSFTSNKYLRIVANRYEVEVAGKWEVLEDATIHEPIFTIKDKITLEPNTLDNQPNKIDTTLGKVIVNKVLLEHNFKDKIDYINTKVSVSDIEKILVIKLKNKEVKVSEYLSFTDSVTFIRGLSMLTNISATPKNILPPPNIDKIKKELYEKFNKKYGEDWVKDRVKVVEYQDELKKVDTEWLKDDPTLGKLLNKKIKDNARVKMYLTFGPEVGFNKDGSNMQFVSNSLMDGYPDTKEELTAMFNSSRSGSYDRGKETQKGGAAAKDILKATSNYTIKEGDCGTTMGKELLVTKDNKTSLINRNILVNGKTIKIDNPDEYIGKVIVLRSPMYCKEKGSAWCSACVGGNMKDYKQGVSLVVTNISSIILNTSMKSMHNSQVSLFNVNLKNIIS